MIIDPHTGAVIGVGPEPSTLAGRAMTTGMGAAGLDQETLPLGWDLATSIPPVTSTMAWNVGRVSNTIVEGGSAGRSTIGRRVGNKLSGGKIKTIRGYENALKEGFFRQGIYQTTAPRRWNRLTTPGNIDPDGPKAYSPFGALAKMGNMAARAVAKRNESVAATLGGGDAFSRGTFGRIAAANRISSMSDSKFLASQSRILNSISWMGEAGNRSVATTPAMRFAMPGAMATAAGQRAAAVGDIMSTVNGVYSGKAIGYIQGAEKMAMAAKTGSMADIRIIQGKPLTDSTRLGFQKGIDAYNKGTLTGRFVGSGAISTSLRAAGPIGKALIVKDLATMGGKITARVAKTAVDAGRDLMAPLNKPVMGSTYRDNSVAATARQRGVQAISNSRLNMRSVLGNEAAAMHAHYG